MMGSIAAEKTTSYANDFVQFMIDEVSYSPAGERIITKATALDGTVITTDWGLLEGEREIGMSNVILPIADYELLVKFAEDTDTTWVWAYKNDIWQVVIRSVTGEYLSRQVGYLASISLSVVSRYPGAEDYELS